jgi:hypothetical protein
MILSVERSGNRTEYHYSIKTRFTKRERLLPERDPRLRCCSISQKETIGSALSLSLSLPPSPSCSPSRENWRIFIERKVCRIEQVPDCIGKISKLGMHAKIISAFPPIGRAVGGEVGEGREKGK